MRKLLLSLVLLACASAAYADRQAAHPFQKTVARGRVQRVVVDIPAGEVRVRNGAADRITVSGRVTRSYDDREDREEAQATVDAIDVDVEVSGSEATIRRRFREGADGWRARTFSGVHVEVEVPAGVSVELETHFGEVDLDGSFGDVAVDLRAGEIHFRSPRASVGELNASVRVGEVHTDFGDRSIDREGVFPGRTTFVNAAGAKSRVSLHTTAGEVHVRLTP